MSMSDALQTVLDYVPPSEPTMMLPVIALALLFVAACAASILYLIRSFPRFNGLHLAIGVLSAVIAFGLYHATGEANGRYEVARQEHLHRASAAVCETVIEGIRSGAVKELMREDVLKIRWVCNEKAFLEAVNSEGATLDITFATSKR